MEVKQNIRQYFTRKFVIPAYQRGYKWGVSHKDGKNDAEILVEQIYQSFQQGSEEYFVQGITIYEKNDSIYLVDGQQRTTTYFLLLSILCKDAEQRKKFLTVGGQPRLDYTIRKESKRFLKKIAQDGFIDMNVTDQDDFQDIFYFKEALRKMSETIERLSSNDTVALSKFTNYILDNVFMFVVIIDEKEAPSMFSMMNGGKAFMKTDELVKADILCKASHSNMVFSANESPENIEQTLLLLRKQLRFETAQEWDTNAVRSRFARQWDKWLYWWNREDVKRFFNSSSAPMGLLLKMYCIINKVEFEYSNNMDDISTTFKLFQNTFLANTEKAKNHFEQIRKLQKKFEALFTNCNSFNYLGLTFCVVPKSERMEAIYYFITHFNERKKLKRYALLRLANVTHQQVLDNNIEEIDGKIKTMKLKLAEKDVYNIQENKNFAFRILFMLNIMAVNNEGQRFTFYYKNDNNWISYYQKRSLEHIWPKSRVYHTNDIGQNISYIDEKSDLMKEITNIEGTINRKVLEELNTSEHCIGNLVFLHIDDNSKFNAKTPEEKKKVYFNLNDKSIVSRNLLHTISRFAFSNWDINNTPEAIKEGKYNTLKAIDNIYEQIK